MDIRPTTTPPDNSVEPPSSVLAVMRGDQIVVWLFGAIDLALRPDLDVIARHSPQFARGLTIEASRVTFCDSGLLQFIARMAGSMPVTVRRPSRVFTQFLTATGLRDRVLVADAEPTVEAPAYEV